METASSSRMVAQLAPRHFNTFNAVDGMALGLRVRERDHVIASMLCSCKLLHTEPNSMDAFRAIDPIDGTTFEAG